jgi:hypothetical protein
MIALQEFSERPENIVAVVVVFRGPRRSGVVEDHQEEGRIR